MKLLKSSILLVFTTSLYANYNIVDTNWQRCFDEDGDQITCKGSAQDAEFIGNIPSYTTNNNGTVKDVDPTVSLSSDHL